MQARLLAGDCWSDVTIQNVSRRGLMAYCNRPPARGEYVELRSGSQVIVGRVAWSAGGTFGIRSQDDIDMDQLTGKPTAPAYAGAERRSIHRAAPSHRPRQTPSEALERSRRLASLLNFVVFALVGVGAAICLVAAVSSVLGEPFRRAASALGSSMTGTALP